MLKQILSEDISIIMNLDNDPNSINQDDQGWILYRLFSNFSFNFDLLLSFKC